MKEKETAFFVADHLKRGAENAITSIQLCKILGISKRKLKELVQKDRKNGAAIISVYSGKGGYYLAKDEEELQKEIQRKTKAAARSLNMFRAMDPAKKDDIKGQLNFY